MFPCPDISYLIACHIPLYQGESPTIAILRKSVDDARLIRIREISERLFHENVMPALVEMSGKLCEFDKTPEIHAHIVFSGLALSGPDINALLAHHWPSESWSYLKLASGGVEPTLDANDERLPLNQFKVPRIGLINAINYAYQAADQIRFALSPEESRELDQQLAVFAERTLTVNQNDPEALMEHKGEGRVIALGVALWHHFHARSVRAGWARDVREIAA